MNDGSHKLIFQLWLEPSEALVLLVVVKLALFKVEHVEGLAIFELLFVEVSDTVGGLLPLSLLYDVNMTCTFKI